MHLHVPIQSVGADKEICSAVYASGLHVTLIVLTRYSATVTMLMSLFRSKAQCFYCSQTLSSRPANPRAFQCPYCECWNRYDKNGGRSAEVKRNIVVSNLLRQEIVSDEPAMHEESLNCTSFAKRGKCSTQETMQGRA